MDFTATLYIVLGGIALLGISAGLILLKGVFPTMRLPIVSRLFPQANQDEYVAIKSGIQFITPNGTARVRHIRPNKADPKTARCLLVDGYGEEYIISVDRSNIYFEPDLSDLWHVMTDPRHAMKWYCNVNRNNEEDSTFMNGKFNGGTENGWNALKRLTEENNILRAQAEEFKTMALDRSNVFTDAKRQIDKAETEGLRREFEAGTRNPQVQTIPRGLPPGQDMEEGM